jgi:hypothetical protein
MYFVPNSDLVIAIFFVNILLAVFALDNRFKL